MALLAGAGCLEPVAKVGCCAKANITDGCVMLNMTTSQLMPEYIAHTESCDNETGYCNVSIEGAYHLVPICTDNELNSCVDPGCTAMVCGDFLFKPKIAPGVVVNDEGEGSVDIPPEEEDEDATLGFYKAQCQFLPMDLKLKSIMKNTKSAINVFRVGIGGSFDEYDNYRYYFPLSDLYCNLNPKLSSNDIRIDRYMNYVGLDFVGGSIEYIDYDAGEIGECMDYDSLGLPEEVFQFGHSSSPSDQYAELYEYQFSQYWKTIYSSEDGDECSYSPFELSEKYRKINKKFYRMMLTRTYIDDIYTAGRAPFECEGPLECYSMACSFDFYSRATNYEIIEGESVEFFADCNRYDAGGGKSIEVCAPTVNVNTDNPSNPLVYTSTEVRFAKVKMKADGYDSANMIEVEELNYPGDCPDVFNAQWPLGCLGDCGDMGNNHRCELRKQWCDFSGNNLGAYYCGSESGGSFGYDNGAQETGEYFTLSGMPAGIRIDGGVAKTDCPQIYGSSPGSGDGNCPVITGEAYPPTGGFVFFGAAKGTEESVMWRGRKVIGYSLGDGMRYTLLGRACNPQGPGTALGNDFDLVEIGDPNGANWQELMDAFAPLYERRIDDIAGQLQKGMVVDDTELAISSMPWVLGYKRWESTTDESYTISSVVAQSLKSRNLLNRPEADADGTSAAELDSHAYNTKSKSANKDAQYLLLYPRHIYIYFEPEEGENFGTSCEYDEVMGAPALSQYGWCEPCTISTLAYQEIEAKDWSYLPLEELSYGYQERICSCSDDGFDCFAPHITDMDEYYGENLLESGAPRTIPDAALIKERLGNYMKSGVLPIIDMTDESNWNKLRPDYVEELEIGPSPFGPIPGFLFGEEEEETSAFYDEYDFERLFGEMGAVIAIVGTIQGDGDYTGEDINTISERAAIIRTHCWRCMTAVRIEGRFTEEEYNDTLTAIFSYPALRKDIDIVALDYSPDAFGFYSAEDDLGQKVVDNMEYLGKTTLALSQKPTIIINFHLVEITFWTLDAIENVFLTIANSQDQLADSGIIGIIYMPARSNLIEAEGIVTVNSLGAGEKGDKFCTVQKGMNYFANPAPTVIYSRVYAVPSINCTRCSAYDKASGNCDMTCENGVSCSLPSGLAPADAKCPDGTIVETCALCNETPGNFQCNYIYQNGTVITQTYPSSYISSDLYMDVVGAVSKPEKCCIEALDGTLYSYNKQVFSGLRSVPAVFPASGGEGATCSGGSLELSGEGFCGLEVVPVRNYDVNCTFIPS